MCNSDVRTAIKNSTIKHWQLADLLKISEATLVRKLRHELSTQEKEKIFNVINNF